MIILAYLIKNVYACATLIILLSYIVSVSVFPNIIFLNIKKKISKKINARSSHIRDTPTLGGIAIFISIFFFSAITAVLLGDFKEVKSILILILGLTLLLFVGIKDDILVVPLRQKLFIQCVSSLLIIFILNIRVNSFQGVMGIYELNTVVSILFTLFIFVLIINAFNLIDGIDGLAGLLSVVFFIFFGIYFLINNKLVNGFMSFSVVGSMLAFLKFNLSNQRKIFMGDSGSMIIGFLLSYQSVSFLAMYSNIDLINKINNEAVFILALLSFPLFDTLQVMITRIKKGKSPFSADRNHIHHKLIAFGLTHIQSSIIIALYTIAMLIISFILQDLDINVHLIIIIGIGSILLLIPLVFKKGKKLIPFFKGFYRL